jgi:hypothetical protein
MYVIHAAVEYGYINVPAVPVNLVRIQNGIL